MCPGLLGQSTLLAREPIWQPCWPKGCIPRHERVIKEAAEVARGKLESAGAAVDVK